jgi:hypothetical protein
MVNPLAFDTGQVLSHSTEITSLAWMMLSRQVMVGAGPSAYLARQTVQYLLFCTAACPNHVVFIYLTNESTNQRTNN